MLDTILLIVFGIVSLVVTGLVSISVIYFLWAKLLGRHMANLGMGTLVIMGLISEFKKFVKK